jgi:hypothetical protein
MNEDDLIYQRRKEDMDNAVRYAIMQAMVPFQLRLERIEEVNSRLSRVVFGDELLPGLVTQMKDISGKLDTIMKQSGERQVLLSSLKRTAELTRWIVVFLGSVAGLLIALNALGVIHL